MINSNKEVINPYALFASIVVTVVGVGIFSYPKEVAFYVGSDGWIVTIFAGIVAYFLLYIAYKAIKVNNYDKFYKIANKNFGTILGGIVCIIFVFFNMLMMSYGMRGFIEVVKMYLIERTPAEFILIATILTSTYLIRGEIETLIKFNEIAFWIMFLPLGLVLLFTLNSADFSNMLPVFNNKPANYVSALQTAIHSFAGFEIVYLLIPFVKNKKNIQRTALKSVVFITIFYIFIIVFSVAVFGKEQSKILLWPTITMIKSVDIPGAFVERWEGIVMAMWIVFYFTTFTNSYYLSADIVKDMFKFKDVKLSSIFISPFIYVLALFPQNIAELYDWGKKILPIYFAFILIMLPLVLLLIGMIKNRKRGGVNGEN